MNNKISWLDLWVYRMVTYISLPLSILAQLVILLSVRVTTHSITTIILLSIMLICMHFKVRLFYWLMYPSAIFTILMFSVGVYPVFTNLGNLNFSAHQWVIFVIYLGSILNASFILYRWRNVRILFKTKKQLAKEGIERIEVSEGKNGRLILSFMIIFNVLSNLYLMIYSTTQLRANSWSKLTQRQEVTKSAPNSVQAAPHIQPVVFQPVKTQKEIENDKKLAFDLALMEQVPEMQSLLQNEQFLVFLENKVVDIYGTKADSLVKNITSFYDISSLPKIRNLVDEYKSYKASLDIKLLFSCTLTDDRRVFIAEKSPVEYTYVIFAKDNQRVELTFNDTLDRIKKNSFLYKDELNFVMQNKTYKYNIVGKDSGTSLIVYNGNKYLSTHHCKANGISWYAENLPVLEIKEKTIKKQSGLVQNKETNPDRIAGFEAAKKFLMANRGKSLETIYSIYTEKMHSYNDFYKFNYQYQEAFKQYANPYGDYAKQILK